MLSSRSNQLVTAPPPLSPPPFQRIMGYRNERMEICIGASAVAADVTSVKKKEGKKKERKKMQRTNKYLHPHRITGRRNIHPPYTSIFPRASIPLLSKHLQFPYYFPRRVSCFVTCRQTEILPPLSPPINRQFDHRHRIGKRLPNAWKRTHTHTRSTRVQNRVLEFFSIFGRELHRRSLEDVSTRDKYRAGCPLGREGDGV